MGSLLSDEPLYYLTEFNDRYIAYCLHSHHTCRISPGDPAYRYINDISYNAVFKLTFSDRRRKDGTWIRVPEEIIVVNDKPIEINVISIQEEKDLYNILLEEPIYNIDLQVYCDKNCRIKKGINLVRWSSSGENIIITNVK